MSHAIPILLYHRLDDSALSTATPSAVFRQHLRWLYEQGWRALSAGEFTHLLRSGRRAPPRSFAITFDDGYESILTAALPVLKEFRFPAIAFVSTSFMKEEQQTVSTAAAERDASAFLSWTQALQLQASGLVDLQSHTHSHPRFANWSIADITADLASSADILASRLGMPRSRFCHLAWPWGDSTPEWRSAATRAGFKYQYTVARQSFQQGTPLDDIPRTCFDAAAFPRFQRQFWLQSGHLSTLWHAAYPYGRRLRQFANLLG